MSPDPARADLTFIVRVSRDRAGRLRGVVERARTGEKWKFEDSPAIGRLVSVEDKIVLELEFRLKRS